MTCGRKDGFILTKKAKEIPVSEQIDEYLKNSEANIVACLYSEPEYFNTYDKLEEEIYNNVWRVLYVIGREMVTTEGKTSLDEISVGFYLEKHPKLKEVYLDFGGYSVVNTLIKLAKIENLEGYIEEHQKYSAIKKCFNRNIRCTPEEFNRFKDMKAEDVYAYFETIINNIFVNVDSKIKTYNLLDDLDETIAVADEGREVGLPVNSPLLNDYIGGNSVGNITLLGANSGIGKTTMTILLLLDSIIKHNEKMVIMINEQDERKWRQELLSYYANTKFGGKFQKKRWREGHFTEEEKGWLAQASNYLKEIKERKNLIIIPFEKYKTSTVVKLIRKYKGLGVNYFILDTFKADADSNNDIRWQQMSDAMVEIYDTIKPASKNVHIWVTLQLTKGSFSKRYLTQENIGQSKNVVDVASTTIYMRRVMQDEMSDGRNKLAVYRLEGKNNNTKIPVELSKDKNYFILFIDKNRFGQGNIQIVVEYDFSLNKYKEIGITSVPEDF